MTGTAKRNNAINAAISLFHRRYVLRILWELRSESLTFRQLQEACNDISPSTLNLRLGDLRAAGLVVHVSGEGYAVSDQGRSLLVAAAPVADWAVEWHGTGKPRRKAAAKPKAAPRKSTPKKRVVRRRVEKAQRR